MYDIIIIGAGPGGYVAAERAGARGKKVLIIEKEHLGGVCLNKGCIPTKTLLNSSKLYKKAKNSQQFGVHTENVTFNLAEAMHWKSEVIENLRNGIAYLMKHNKVEVVTGEAKLLPGKKVLVGGKEYSGENILLATGSSPFVPPIPGADSKNVLNSTDVLNLEKLPSSVVVIGGGVIGLEFASFFSNLGIKTDIVEMMDEIIPFMDKDLAKLMRREMKGIKFHLTARVEKIVGSKVHFSKNGKIDLIDADLILMAVGRKSNIDSFEGSGLDIERGRVKVDEKMRTNLPGVYAIGDVTGESLLAHSASRMGEVVVQQICGGYDHMRYNAVPWAVYTYPEAAGCGMTESEAIEKGIRVKTASMQMRGNGRFLAENGKKAGGICKVVVNAETDILLGVHLLGAQCSEMIAGAATMIEAELRVNEIKEIIYPHPSVSEIIKDTLWNL